MLVIIFHFSLLWLNQPPRVPEITEVYMSHAKAKAANNTVWGKELIRENMNFEQN